MKRLFFWVRILTGLLFVFSGIVKLNDPSGFSIKLNEYFDVFAEDASTQQDSIQVQMVAKNEGGQVFAESMISMQELYAFDRHREWSIQAEHDGRDYRYSLSASGMSLTQFDVYDSSANGHDLVLNVKQNDQLESTIFHWNDSVSSESWTAQVDVSSWVKPESALHGLFKSLKNYSLWFSGFFCALEVLLGIAMLLGYEMRVTIAVTAVLIVFFTFLTGYSAYFQKVTDCGCFGDFLKLDPWTSFKKDLVLSAMVSVLLLGQKFNVPVFSRPFGHKFMGVCAALLTGFGFYCYGYLPVWDFLPYKEGNNIKAIMETLPPGERATDSMRITFVLKKGSDTVHTDAYGYAAWAEKGFEYHERIEEIIEKGYEWPIHDFSIIDMEKGEDLTSAFLNHKGYQWLYVAAYVDQAYQGALPGASLLAAEARKRNQPFYGLSSTSSDLAAQYALENKLPFPFYSTDQKTLLTMARYNPTLYLFKGPVVIRKWSGRNLPDAGVFNSSLMP